MTLKSRNQADLAICSSEAAAQLVDAWRISHLPAGLADKDFESLINLQSASLPAAIDAAIIESRGQTCQAERVPYKGSERLTMPFEGTSTCSAVEALIQNGSCSQEFLMRELQKTKSEDLTSAIKSLEDFSKIRMTCDRLNEVGMKILEEKLKVRACLLKGLKPDLNLYQALQQLAENTEKELKADNSLQNLKKKIDEICKKNRVPFASHASQIPTCHSDGINEHTPKQIFDHLNQKNPQPLGIGFNDCFLFSERSFLNGGSANQLISSGCGGHAAVIVGSRPNPDDPNKCEYLILNSWGAECRGYASRFKHCEKDTGKVWVDADELLSQSQSLDYLQ